MDLEDGEPDSYGLRKPPDLWAHYQELARNNPDYHPASSNEPMTYQAPDDDEETMHNTYRKIVPTHNLGPDGRLRTRAEQLEAYMASEAQAQQKRTSGRRIQRRSQIGFDPHSSKQS